MNPAAIDEMRDRIRRSLQSARTASGDRYQTSYKTEDKDFTTNFTAIGVKAPEQLNDEFLTLFVWVWSLKDYIKSAFEAGGIRGQVVEDEIDSCVALTYVSDIANRAKHGTLRTSRSGQHAELVDVGFSVPQTSIQEIIVSGPDVTMTVTNPEQVEIHAFVVTQDGARLDALVVLAEAMNFWEAKLLS